MNQESGREPGSVIKTIHVCMSNVLVMLQQSV